LLRQLAVLKPIGKSYIISTPSPRQIEHRAQGLLMAFWDQHS